MTKRSISGLTTGTTILTTVSLGIVLGMGFYDIAVGENLVVRSVDEEAQKEITAYFEGRNITYFTADFRMDNDLDTQATTYTEHYTLNISSRIFVSQIIHNLGKIESVIYASSQRNIV